MDLTTALFYPRRTAQLVRQSLRSSQVREWGSSLRVLDLIHSNHLGGSSHCCTSIASSGASSPDNARKESKSKWKYSFHFWRTSRSELDRSYHQRERVVRVLQAQVVHGVIVYRPAVGHGHFPVTHGIVRVELGLRGVHRGD